MICFEHLNVFSILCTDLNEFLCLYIDTVVLTLCTIKTYFRHSPLIVYVSFDCNHGYDTLLVL